MIGTIFSGPSSIIRRNIPAIHGYNSFLCRIVYSYIENLQHWKVVSRSDRGEIIEIIGLLAFIDLGGG